MSKCLNIKCDIRFINELLYAIAVAPKGIHHPFYIVDSDTLTIYNKKDKRKRTRSRLKRHNWPWDLVWLPGPYLWGYQEPIVGREDEVIRYQELLDIGWRPNFQDYKKKGE